MIVALLLASTASAEMRDTGSFHGVVNQSPGEVTITLGPTLAVQVDGSLEETQKIRTEVRKGVLVITAVKGAKFSGDVPRVNITVPTLDQVGSESAGDVTLSGTLAGDDLQLWARSAGSLVVGDVKGTTVSLIAEGAGDLTAGKVSGDTVLLASRAGSDVKAVAVTGDATVYEVIGAGRFTVERHSGRYLEARLSGAAILDVVGTVTTLKLDASSAAGARLAGLRATDVEARLSNTATAHVWADGTLEAEASGASQLIYSGEPKVGRRTSGASSIEPHGAPKEPTP